MSPDVTVIEKTAARVITIHLLTASGGTVMPSAGWRVVGGLPDPETLGEHWDDLGLRRNVRLDSSTILA
jgi:hypothetical protein